MPNRRARPHSHGYDVACASQVKSVGLHAWVRGALLTALMMCAAAMATAQNSIQSISSSQQGGAEVIRVELSEALASLPKGFTVQAPPRVAIDLPGVGNAMGKSSIEVNQGNLRSVSVAQAGERTRLVLNLRQASNYRAELQGKALVLILEASSAPQLDGP